MDELKLLMEMLSHLPNAALWVLSGYLLYKVVVVGSIYGVVRFGIRRLFDWLQAKKTAPVEYKEIRPMLDGMCIRTETDRLIAQLHRLRGRRVSIQTEYIHSASVDWLREAIDEKIERDRRENIKVAA